MFPKRRKHTVSQKYSKKSGSVSLWGSIWEALGALFDILFACRFYDKK